MACRICQIRWCRRQPHTPGLSLAEGERGRIKAGSKGALFCILGIAASVAFFLASLEICFRVIQPKGLQIRMRQTLPGVKPEVLFEVNKFGFRSLSMSSREKPPGVFRIIALGASTTVQTNQATEDTWAGRLEAMLNAARVAGNAHVEVDAYAAGADDIRETMDFVATSLFSYAPDLVILLVGGNDLTYKRFLANSASSPGLARILDNSKAWAFFRQSYLYYTQSRSGPILEWHSANLPLLRSRFLTLPEAPASIAEDSSLATFAEGERQLLHSLRARSVPVAVLGAPSLWKKEMSAEEEAARWIGVNLPEPHRPRAALMAREMDRLNEKQAELAKEENAVFIPLDKRIPKTLEYFFDEVHFTDKGSRLVAETIFPEIAQRVRSALRENTAVHAN